MNGRRLLIQQTFQLILIHKSPFPVFPQEIASTTTIVDLRPHTDGVVRYFQMRGLERIMPDLFAENSKIYFRLFRCLALLEKLDGNCMSLIRGRQGSGLWEETEMITDLVRKRTKVRGRLTTGVSFPLIESRLTTTTPVCNNWATQLPGLRFLFRTTTI